MTTDDETLSDVDASEPPAMHRPWKPIRKWGWPGTCFILAKQNYKVRAMIGMSTQSMVELISVLDTGAGSSFIRKDALSEEVQAEIKPLGNEVRVRDANKRQLRLAGTVDLKVTIGNRDQLVTFYVAEQLATPVILGCDFCDKHIEAIKPRRRVVELVDGTTVPIIRTNKHRTTTFTIQPAHVRTRSRRAASSKVVLHKTMELPAHSQTWVSVTSKKAGLTLIESHDRLYQNWLCLAATGVAQVQPGKPFDILVANFSEEPVTLSKGLRVATATVHPKRLRESKISHGEMLGVFTDEEILTLNLETTKYQKRGDLNAKDPDRSIDTWSTREKRTWTPTRNPSLRTTWT